MTKPTFIVLVPALLVVCIVYRKDLFTTNKLKTYFVVGIILPILAWFSVQFAHDSFASVLHFYTHPGGVNGVDSILGNLRRFASEVQPMYMGALFAVWTAALAVRIKDEKKVREIVGPEEMIAWIFSASTLVMYFITPGYYRYFFPAQFLSLIFVVPAFMAMMKRQYVQFIFVCIGLLVLFHGYKTFFDSWISSHFDTTRSAQLTEHVGGFDATAKIFFYQVPEAVNFLPASKEDYYQYFVINSIRTIGQNKLEVLQQGIPDIVMTQEEYKNLPIFAKYKVVDAFDSYIVLKRKNP